MAISSIAGSSLKVSAFLSAANNLTPTNLSPTSNSSNITKSFSWVLGANIAYGVNQLASFITTIAASGNASIDLTVLTNLLQQTAVVLVRVKSIMIQLLSLTDDTVNGTNCSSITINNTVTNAFSAQSNSGWFGNAAEGAAGGSKFVIPNGGTLAFATPAAAGVLVDGTHKVINYVNNDGSNGAAVQTTIFGADA